VAGGDTSLALLGRHDANSTAGTACYFTGIQTQALSVASADHRSNGTISLPKPIKAGNLLYPYPEHS